MSLHNAAGFHALPAKVRHQGPHCLRRLNLSLSYFHGTTANHRAQSQKHVKEYRKPRQTERGQIRSYENGKYDSSNDHQRYQHDSSDAAAPHGVLPRSRLHDLLSQLPVGSGGAEKNEDHLAGGPRVSLKSSNPGLLPGARCLPRCVSDGFLLSHLIQFEILGLRREQQTDERHHRANGQNHRR